MYKIVRKKELNSAVTLMEIEAPFVARKAKAGQFIIFRVDEQGERVPLTIAGYDREKGTVSIIFQKVGFSTNARRGLRHCPALRRGLQGSRLRSGRHCGLPEQGHRDPGG